MKLILIAVLALLTACTSLPYHPPVVVKDSKPFAGVVQLLAEAPNRELDIILVHGICTHDQQWAVNTINLIVQAAERGAAPASSQPAGNAQGLQIVTATSQLAAGTLHFSAFVWSPLTASDKQLLAYDLTGTPTDCANDAVCKPVRARLNGIAKDRLLDDCLADAVIYAGTRKASINGAFIDAITTIVDQQTQRNGGKTVPLALISESLGSKMTLDALNLMMQTPDDMPAKRAASAVVERMNYLYMAANQLPLLSLADRDPGVAALLADGRRNDALSRFLDRQTQRRAFASTTVVAFTDPNDLLSYLLLPRHYGERVAIANVLVSNDKTWFGYLENPYTAHVGYLANDDVTRAIVCGIPASGYCK